MSRLAGRNGALYAGVASGGTAEPIAYLKHWTLDRKTDRYDGTAFGDTGKVYVAGLPDAQGTYDGFYDDATNQLYTAAGDGVARKFYLYPDTTAPTKYFFGTGFFDMSVDVAVDGIATLSGSWNAASPVIKV